MLCSEGGVLKYLVIYIREWVRITKFPAPDNTTMNSATVLAKLSERYYKQATALKLRAMHKLFNEKHGVISSAHYRSLAMVCYTMLTSMLSVSYPVSVCVCVFVSAGSLAI